ncbi:hypothetical protein B0H11DRAFT_2224002 [Mycena galericulata]|nr:hypothetical protein B0H11DRAFT_2224002 [Mycena galericulata]
MHIAKAEDDGSIFQGPDTYSILLDIELQGQPRSPLMHIGRFVGSSEDGDAPMWTRFLKPRSPLHVQLRRSPELGSSSGLWYDRYTCRVGLYERHIGSHAGLGPHHCISAAAFLSQVLERDDPSFVPLVFPRWTLLSYGGPLVFVNAQSFSSPTHRQFIGVRSHVATVEALGSALSATLEYETTPSGAELGVSPLLNPRIESPSGPEILPSAPPVGCLAGDSSIAGAPHAELSLLSVESTASSGRPSSAALSCLDAPPCLAALTANLGSLAETQEHPFHLPFEDLFPPQFHPPPRPNTDPRVNSAPAAASQDR